MGNASERGKILDHREERDGSVSTKTPRFYPWIEGIKGDVSTALRLLET